MVTIALGIVLGFIILAVLPLIGGTEGGGFFKYRDGSFSFNYLGPTRAHTILAVCLIL